jgi:hypothetical protein
MASGGAEKGDPDGEGEVEERNVFHEHEARILSTSCAK